MFNNEDALAYSYIKNNLVENDHISKYKREFDFGGNDTQVNSSLNDVLMDTTIKRACCLRTPQDMNKTELNIKVRIPIPENINLGDYGSDEKKYTDYGFFEKQIKVPSALCKDVYKRGDRTCDNFYQLYCENQKSFHKKANKSTPFNMYCPECACYGDMPQSGQFATIPPKCVVPGCETITNSYYLDPNSRDSQCSMTICTANFHAEDISVGGDANITPNVEQKCGNGSPATDKLTDMEGAIERDRQQAIVLQQRAIETKRIADENAIQVMNDAKQNIATANAALEAAKLANDSEAIKNATIAKETAQQAVSNAQQQANVAADQIEDSSKQIREVEDTIKEIEKKKKERIMLYGSGGVSVLCCLCCCLLLIVLII
jgi:hypothetical protein